MDFQMLHRIIETPKEKGMKKEILKFLFSVVSWERWGLRIEKPLMISVTSYQVFPKEVR